MNLTLRGHRRSIRLPGRDYAQSGAYFVTICTDHARLTFGDVLDDRMVPNDAGRIVEQEWARSASIRDEIELDAFVVMPNHVHGIVIIKGDLLESSHKPSGRGGPARQSLGATIAGFKAATTRRIRLHKGAAELAVWQRNYYERIVRHERELIAIREYIADNPRKWAQDPNHPTRAINRLAPLRR